VLEGLDEPGEWYWDTSLNKLYIIPHASSSESALFTSASAAAEMSVLVPQHDKLLYVGGGASWVEFADIQFKHAAVGDRVNQYHSRNSAIQVENARCSSLVVRQNS
jgi:hypothetical protein